MEIALTKRRENIAEYILYLWQLEDLLRALQFSPEAMPSPWHAGIAKLLREEGKEAHGHLDHTLHLIADLNDLHLRLLELPAGEHYKKTFAHLQPELPRLRGKFEGSDVELMFRSLYAAMLYRIKGEGAKADDVIELVSPVVAELSAIYGKVERGEMDLFGE